MLSEQEQINVLRPFKVLVSKFESELEIANKALADGATNPELNEKIRQLEKGKREVEEFVQNLTPKLQVGDNEVNEMTSQFEPNRVGFASILQSASALYNFKYTIEQKNEINRRITAVNSSRVLSNDDMNVLQKQWTSILGLRNDVELAESKKKFEDRLLDWENLIAKKHRGSR